MNGDGMRECARKSTKTAEGRENGRGASCRKRGAMEEETGRGGRRGLPRGQRSEGLSGFDGWVAGGVKVAERIAGQRAGEKDEEIYMPRSAS